jgi:hypothetical protein
MRINVRYNIYSTLLDGYSDYVHSADIYDKYWGFSESPGITPEEFEQKQFQGLIDKINRVPMKWEDSEKADRGTAFNEIVDCIVSGRKSEKMDISSPKEAGMITAAYNNRKFVFPISICREFADYFKGAQSQVFTEAVLPTGYGDVLLYGYIDELMPLSVHDIKTTGNYEAWKFKGKWQRIVYPYCLNENGNAVNRFEYNILVTDKYGNNETVTEEYGYTHDEATIDCLRLFVEGFIQFLEENRGLITDGKIFNIHKENA